MASLLKTLPLLVALATAPALAAESPKAPVSKAPMHMDSMSSAQMHEHCKTMMGHKMEGRTPHEHSAEKLGHAPPRPTPPSDAEMKKMHEKCEAIMAEKPQGPATQATPPEHSHEPK